MGDYKKNPRQPFVVRVPNKIRKKLWMHETNAAAAARLKFTRYVTRLEKIAALPWWSRFSNKVKNFLGR